jgi:hypothetical protein
MLGSFNRLLYKRVRCRGEENHPSAQAPPFIVIVAPLLGVSERVRALIIARPP